MLLESHSSERHWAAPKKSVLLDSVAVAASYMEELTLMRVHDVREFDSFLIYSGLLILYKHPSLSLPKLPLCSGFENFTIKDALDILILGFSSTRPSAH